MGKKSGKAQWEQLGLVAQAQPEEIRERRTAAEGVYGSVLSRLGAPGTYDTPTGGVPASAPGGAAPTEDSGIFKDKELLAGRSGIPGVSAKLIDKDKYMTQLEGSSQFRTMSRLQGEAEQLIAREGPLYDEMLNNIQLPIIEGNAAVARENADELGRAMARGGSARRNAFESIQKIRAQERQNSQKVQQLSQARFALDRWSRENAKTQLEFGQSWASNLAGVRESYQSAMDSASALMLNAAMPIMMESRAKYRQLSDQIHAEKRAKTGAWISGIMGVASLALGGMGAMGAFAGSSGMLGKIGGALEEHSGALAQTGMEQLGLGLGR